MNYIIVVHSAFNSLFLYILIFKYFSLLSLGVIIPAKFFNHFLIIDYMPENICPVCGEVYNRKKVKIIKRGNKEYKYIYFIHYYGYYRDENGHIKKKEIYHEIKFEDTKDDTSYAFRIQKPDQNIKLRPFTDKNRFIKYIEESLELMRKQDDFSDEKIIKVLDKIEKWLGKVIDEENKKMIIEKLDEMKKSLS